MIVVLASKFSRHVIIPLKRQSEEEKLQQKILYREQRQFKIAEKRKAKYDEEVENS